GGGPCGETPAADHVVPAGGARPRLALGEAPEARAFQPARDLGTGVERRRCGVDEGAQVARDGESAGHHGKGRGEGQGEQRGVRYSNGLSTMSSALQRCEPPGPPSTNPWLEAVRPLSDRSSGSAMSCVAIRPSDGAACVSRRTPPCEAGRSKSSP